jgi:predicted SnoaL-like aldol condensation-catalyzing enzyme
MRMPHKQIAIEFLTMAARGDVAEAYARHVATEFTHHNPYFAHDRQSLLDAMSASAATEPNKSFEVMRVIEDADTVAVHSRLTRASANLQYAVVHILKFDGDKIAEMWDIVQEVPAESPNAIGMF